jgi:hypothetical protein
MMDERELDRAIDAAAGAMVAREPSRSLGYSVMARVREGKGPAPRRFGWMTAAASFVLFGAIAITVMSRTSVTLAPLPRAAQLVVGQPPVTPRAPAAAVAEALPTRPVIREPLAASRAGRRAPLPLNDVSPIEPIHTEPIVLSSIDVPQLERETTAIDTLTIEPLTIEPLAASND